MLPRLLCVTILLQGLWAFESTEDLMASESGPRPSRLKPLVNDIISDDNDTSSFSNHNESTEMDENDFCGENYVDSAYYNGYDTILTRGDRLWYYHKDKHRISKAYDQRRFTQGKYTDDFEHWAGNKLYCTRFRESEIEGCKGLGDCGDLCQTHRGHPG